MRVMKKATPPEEGMKRYRGFVSMGLVGCKREFMFDVPEDADEAEIEEAGCEAMLELISWDFSPADHEQERAPK